MIISNSKTFVFGTLVLWLSLGCQSRQPQGKSLSSVIGSQPEIYGPWKGECHSREGRDGKESQARIYWTISATGIQEKVEFFKVDTDCQGGPERVEEETIKILDRVEKDGWTELTLAFYTDRFGERVHESTETIKFSVKKGALQVKTEDSQVVVYQRVMPPSASEE